MVENNARWCDAVCRSHGLATRLVDDLWVAPHGSPRFYPDAITLRPGVSAGDVVTGMPDAAESVKDSFARLALLPHGFDVLFDAHWIVHDAPALAAPALDWTSVRTEAEFVAWTAAAGLAGIIRLGLLVDPAIRIFAGRANRDGPIIAGFTANATGGVVGVANVFSGPPDAQVVWHDVRAVLAAAFPGRQIVGYEQGDPLDDAIESGFSLLLGTLPSRGPRPTAPVRPTGQ